MLSLWKSASTWSVSTAPFVSPVVNTSNLIFLWCMALCFHYPPCITSAIHLPHACCIVVQCTVKNNTGFTLATNTVHYFVNCHQPPACQNSANIAWTDKVYYHLLTFHVHLFSPLQICCSIGIPLGKQPEHVHKFSIRWVISPKS